MPSPKHFAVLIGVDLYIKDPLKSCVRDVHLVETYLKQLQQENRFNLLDITKLTASNPTGQESGVRAPPESDEALPTLHNIKKTLSRVVSESAEGDYIYVHFSGHGTVSQNRELALVLFGCQNDDDEPLRDCLTGVDLVKLLNGAVVKKAKVLLVLDCCFSGNMHRHKLPDAIRYIPFAPLSNTEGTESQLHQAYQSFFPSDTTFRGASARENWLMDPKGYTILMACGPAQTTHGLKFSDGGHGALSYILVRALEKLGSLNMSHMVLFQIICTMFRAMGSHQTPQLKGSGDFTFFGNLYSPDDSFFPIAKLPSGKIVLQAGQIMGVLEDDKLALSPLNVFTRQNWDNWHHEYRIGTAQKVGGVTAEVKLDGFDSANIGSGWIARLLKFCEDVSTISSSPNHSRSMGDSLREPDQQFQKSVLLPPGFTEATALVKATVNDQGSFEIHNREGRRVDFDALSLLPAHSPSARNQVLRVLAYLTRYHEIVSMEPLQENEMLRNSVDITLCTEFGDPFSDTEAINVAHGETLWLSIVNNGEKPVFVNVFCLKSDWEIENMVAAENTVLPPHKSTVEDDQDFELGFRMMVPEQYVLRGIDSCEDILKIFITTRLVPLGNLAAVKPILRGSQEGLEDELRDSWITRAFRIRTVKPVLPS